LDDAHVESLWLAKHRVNWKTGEPLGGEVTDGKAHTHCSAFVAAFCMRQGVYILRPPEHGTVLLANAQYDWLHHEGKNNGWRHVSTAQDAQRLANEGLLVVASFKEGKRGKAGHIAIIRPSTKAASKIDDEGPQITQAGKSNLRSASLQEGFKHHPAAWRDAKVRYYAHELNGTHQSTNRCNQLPTARK
jgi:hypothetical protein